MRNAVARRLRAAHGTGVVVALVALALAAPAAADESLAPSGSLTYTWHGDPARGCAAANLCGVQGALTVEAQGTTTGGTSNRITQVGIEFSAGTVRVLGAPGAAPGACVDVPSGTFGGSLVIRHGPHGSLFGQVEPPLSSGRCVGPTEQDLGGIRFPVVKTGTERRSFDLRSTQAFAAGPFSGSVVSTLVLTATANGGLGGLSGGGSGSFFGPPPVVVGVPSRRKVLLERVVLRDRLRSLSGALDVAFSGGSGGFCVTLGSCGASGTLALTLPGFDRTLTITATRVVRRRVSARQALADLRHGRLSFETGVPPPASLTTQVTETFQAPDGATCVDTAVAREAALFFGDAPGARGSSITLSDPDGAGVVRSHCPGPGDSDAFGNFAGNPFGGIARATVAPAALTSGDTAVRLVKPGSTTGLGYVATRSGAIELELSLVRVLHAGTIQVTR